SVFFFFQAEDGIRDRNVTGVQTCALPIFIKSSRKNVLKCLVYVRFYPSIVSLVVFALCMHLTSLTIMKMELFYLPKKSELPNSLFMKMKQLQSLKLIKNVQSMQFCWKNNLLSLYV